MNNFDKEVRKAYIRGIFNRQKNYLHAPGQLQEIMAEHGFDYVDHNCCDGFCPDCGQMHSCEAYEEIKDEWKGFYT
jgi:hypothetical protein